MELVASSIKLRVSGATNSIKSAALGLPSQHYYNNNSLKLYLLHWSQQTDNKMLSSLAYWKDNSHLIMKVPAHKRMRAHIVEYIRDALRIHVPVCVI